MLRISWKKTIFVFNIYFLFIYFSLFYVRIKKLKNVSRFLILLNDFKRISNFRFYEICKQKTNDEFLKIERDGDLLRLPDAEKWQRCIWALFCNVFFCGHLWKHAPISFTSLVSLINPPPFIQRHSFQLIRFFLTTKTQ